MSSAPKTVLSPRRPLGFWGTLRSFLAGVDAGSMLRHGSVPPARHGSRPKSVRQVRRRE